jgi:hypothetical protein
MRPCEDTDEDTDIVPKWRILETIFCQIGHVA